MKIVVETDLAVPMRDGVMTRGDLYRPEGGDALPTLVCRTPYGKGANRGLPILPDPLQLAERGYAVLMIDVRGRFASEGEWEPFVNERCDGYDTLEWIVGQPWSNGRTGMFGASYFAATALAAAAERHPSLACALSVLTADDYYDGWTYSGGCLQLGFAGNWALMLAASDPNRQTPEAMQVLIDAIMDPTTLQRRPLTELGKIAGPSAERWWKDWLEHDRRDSYWEAKRPSADYAKFEIPILHIGGWNDIFCNGTVANFQGLAKQGRAQQKLILGPWAHGAFDRTIGEMDYGLFSNPLLAGLQDHFCAFFDRYLKDQQSEQPTVRYFVMGANEWRTSESWPPEGTQRFNLYVRGSGNANTAAGDGALDEIKPDAEPADHFTYDPLDPVPTHGGPIFNSLVGGLSNLPGSRDQREVERRQDVLCYTGPALTEPLVLAGPVTMHLWATTGAADTDWTAKLVDVWPDGRAMSLCDGIIRAAMRQGLEQLVPCIPNEPALYEISLGHTAHSFDLSHRVRVEISSSNAPRFRPNPNTGEELPSATSTCRAEQTIHHNERMPSQLELTILRSEREAASERGRKHL